MSGRFKQENERKIMQAFERFKANSYERVLVVLKDLMQEAMEFALKTHDERHRNHLEMGDGYGWALWHRGTLVAYDIAAINSEISGDAFEKLMAISPYQHRGRWFGVLLADMQPSHYFAVDYENDILNQTAQMSSEKFRQFFKPYNLA